MALRVWSPGRVNLIGDHTDYLGGLALPFAIPLGIRFEVEASDGRISLRSDRDDASCDVELPCADPARVEPRWARYVAAVAEELSEATSPASSTGMSAVTTAAAPTIGLRGSLASTLPLGSGLSSSAALSIGVAAALQAVRGVTEWDRRQLSLIAQAAEQRASGVPCGLLDQYAIAFGEPGCVTRIDFSADTVTPVSVPDGVDFWIIHSGVARELSGSEYGTRRAQCEAAETVIGPLAAASLDDLDAFDSLDERRGFDELVERRRFGSTDGSAAETLRRRARHVITENARVDAMIAALKASAFDDAGAILREGHRSLAIDFETSTPVVDQLIEHLMATPGVHGARMTGGGFGGCVVAMTTPGIDPTPAGLRGWHVRPSIGVSLEA
ncbi:MAG: galactokinase [Actinobacteria bacterium]|nr:galactokinase [Actinomycetota bacterium]